MRRQWMKHTCFPTLIRTMNTDIKTIISCKGFQVGDLRIPEFELKMGQIVTLIWPLPKGHPSEAAVMDVLVGHQKHPQILVNGLTARATRPQFRRTLFGSVRLVQMIDRLMPRKLKLKYYNMSRWQYAMKHQGRYVLLTPIAEEDIRERLKILPNSALDAVQGTGTALLGLHMAWDTASVAIFDTVGCSPNTMYEAIQRGLSKGKAALEIAYIKSDELEFDAYPNSPKFRVELVGY